MKSQTPNRCIVNLGLYKSGTTTLAKAAQLLGMNVYDKFPLICTSHDDSESFTSVTQDTLKKILFDPKKAIDDCIKKYLDAFIDFFHNYDFVSDGWFSLLPIASPTAFTCIKDEARNRGIQLIFVSTLRELEAYLHSELHHWVRFGIEKKAGLDFDERSNLHESLANRYKLYMQCLERLFATETVIRLSLEDISKDWASSLSNISDHNYNWTEVLEKAGNQNCSPNLPIEGILLTARICNNFVECLKNVTFLLDDIERDPLCNYLLVLALDDDEYDSVETKTMINALKGRSRLQRLHLLRNPPRKQGEPPKICHIWARMAKHAWQNGASWVTFLGDDVRIKCPFHYRAIYRSFLDHQEKFQLTKNEFFGCPWFNDLGFKGFPTFPVIGKEHFHIFGGLIPDAHKTLFINQDLDPYLQRLYLKFGAAPLLNDVHLVNSCGGSELGEARYKRIAANRWKEKVLDNAVCVVPIQSYLQEHFDCSIDDDILSEQSLLLVDVVVPSYRINIKYLQDICSIEVPSYMRTTIIIIIDNPSLLKKKMSASKIKTSSEAAFELENLLTNMPQFKNNIRIRCNEYNLGASASRNRGIEESSAEYILFLDDDVIPSKNLLHEYGKALKTSVTKKEPILGLIGLVRFPRYSDMSIIHAAVVMSYLIFAFEISASNIYKEPAWGVTANILYTKFPGMSFDTQYAKTGGGEDVDFALRLSEKNGNLKLKCCPSAQVEHLFWSNRVYDLCSHFFNWAIGDSALFQRFEKHVYRSYPNFVETWLFFCLPCALAIFTVNNSEICYLFYHLITVTVAMFFCDVAVDLCWKRGAEFKHRRSLLEKEVSTAFAVLAHIWSNFYVIILECGRLFGHLRRGHVRNISRRFDWHCGQLEKSKMQFAQREALKFILFLLTFLICSYIFD